MISNMFTTLFEEDEWVLSSITMPYLAYGGWNSIIGHQCYKKEGHYFTLLRHHTQPNECKQCCEKIPDNIVTLFKFHNWESIK